VSEMSDWIVSNPEVLGGKPCIRGTRISVQHVLELLASGASQEDVLRSYPQVTREALSAALEYAARALDDQGLWEVKVSA
jgi:uncharacterized protein (DUF433 family)